jgi:hypothetical protein
VHLCVYIVLRLLDLIIALQGRVRASRVSALVIRAQPRSFVRRVPTQDRWKLARDSRNASVQGGWPGSVGRLFCSCFGFGFVLVGVHSIALRGIEGVSVRVRFAQEGWTTDYWGYVMGGGSYAGPCSYFGRELFCMVH